MDIPQNEIISFSIITIVVLMLAFLTKKIENKHNDNDVNE